MDIADWIQRNRAARNWSQGALARELKADVGNVSRWERGKHLPDLESFRSLCVLFGASADEALQLEEQIKRAAPVSDDHGDEDVSAEPESATKRDPVAESAAR